MEEENSSHPPISSNSLHNPNAFAGLSPPCWKYTTPERICRQQRRWFMVSGSRRELLPLARSSRKPRWMHLQASYHRDHSSGAQESPGEEAHCFPTLQFHPRASNMSGSVCLFCHHCYTDSATLYSLFWFAKSIMNWIRLYSYAFALQHSVYMMNNKLWTLG